MKNISRSIASAAVVAGLIASSSADAAAAYMKLHDFGRFGDGISPYSSLTNLGGTLYGTTVGGGAGGANCSSISCGTVFAIDPATGTESVLYPFQGGTDAEIPYAGLVGHGTTLYGTTTGGGAGEGTVFSVTTSGTEKVLYAFPSGGANGDFIQGGLVRVKSDLYGTAADGGKYGHGALFKTTLAGKTRILYFFRGNYAGATDAGNPEASLISINDILYGTSAAGGGYGCGGTGCGTVFKYDPATRTEKVLHVFGGSDGSTPDSNLIDVGGTLYGTAENGGAHGNGVVFKIDATTGTFSVIYGFAGGKDGANPIGGLVKNGTALYGTTENGGTANDGTVFAITTAGKEKAIYSFLGSSSNNDGANPVAGLLNVKGTLYGTTWQGGIWDEGTVFSIKP